VAVRGMAAPAGGFSTPGITAAAAKRSARLYPAIEDD